MANKTVYTLVELQTTEFDDKEINNVLNNNVFIFSCIYNMFKFCKSKYSEEKIRNIIKQDNWMCKRTWSWEEHDNYIVEVSKCFKNVFQYNYRESLQRAQDFVFRYGFNVKDTKENEIKHYNRLKEFL